MSASVLYDTPGPRARVRNNVLGAVAVAGILGLLYFIWYRLDQTGQFQSYLWKPYEYTTVQQRIVDGILATLKAFALAAVFSLVLAAVLASGRLSDHTAVRRLATTVVEFFRAMPLVVMIFALYVGVFTQTPLWALVTGLSLYNGAVQSEIFRAGINSVPKGQSEAAYAIGLRKSQVMVLVLLPQAVRAMLPSIISQLVVTLKDTSLGFLITYEELLYQGKLIAQTSHGFPYIPTLMIIAPIYIAMCLALTALAHWIERRSRRSPKGAPPAAPEAAREVAKAE
ncbi:amino acid ABC transporter permease [Actinacidiphila oryziradicis]|uniref:amino acid ABC transporter permease n=1 Tax=Actinacidiphila oryziradicis TaxID=2571141 RepID=UPI0023F40BE6|nr:amino acid ABC transporter permease [Actinacidiphila oryziradicis]MCW2869100.1 gluD [Actinacidiphila oryziradicis]